MYSVAIIYCQICPNCPSFPIHLCSSPQSSCPPVKLKIGDPSKLYWSPIKVGDVTWNFEKFLADAEGVPYKRFDHSVNPENLVPAIDALVAREDERNQIRKTVSEYFNPDERLDF